MCGIVGYTGRKEAEPILVEGLRRLEYRGYDSSGVATLTGSRLHLRKKAGRIHDLARHLRDQPAPGCVGIGHTRWATHGPANDRNAHPHLGCDGLVAVVHNGVIENYTTLKRQLEADGVVFRSDTDTEVVAHLIARCLRETTPAGAFHRSGALEVGDFIDAVSKSLALLKGTYGLAVVCPLFPEVVIGARLGSPLVLGIGDDENFLASDPGALVGNAELHAQGNLRATRGAGKRPARPAQRRRRHRPLRRP
jgi:glucosamine--fructose-6-phosphate aminotransferase (isomerizing)